MKLKTFFLSKILSRQYAESGRSMVEILGVLAVVGVLSIAGISGYTFAMNRHKANVLLEEATRRATVVAGHITFEKTPSIDEFSNKDFGYAIFDDKVYGEDGSSLWEPSEKRFSLRINKVDRAVCQHLRNIVGGIVQGFVPLTCVDESNIILTYFNDLSIIGVAEDYTTEESCTKASYKWCLATQTCVKSNCCIGKNSQCCDSNTGEFLSYENKICDFNEGVDNGICLEGQCVENLTNKTCNINNYVGNPGCGGVNSGFFCFYNNASPKCRVMSREERTSGKLKTDPREGRGTDWYSAMNFCHALGKKLPSFSDVSIVLTSGRMQCYLIDCFDGGATLNIPCNSGTTLEYLQERFSNTTNAVWVSNSDGSYSFVMDLGFNYPGYVYYNHKTSPVGLAVCE